MGVAEEACQFEHRDLHWGNLLIRRAEGPGPGTTVHARLRGVELDAATAGVTVRVWGAWRLWHCAWQAVACREVHCRPAAVAGWPSLHAMYDRPCLQALPAPAQARRVLAERSC